MIRVKWKIREMLEANNITAYRLWKDSGLAQQTVYTLAQNKGDRVDLNTLSTVITTLERLTHRRVELADVLEVVRNA
ncbi:MAG: helix-turn-helix transcriptional regulator [Meiothermus sp.]|nr:helix-turn-helix transcriptional regulator [Meiothermus sp.]